VSELEQVTSDKSAVQLLQEINSGQTNPRKLDKASRQQCVDFLKLEGYAHAQIAQVLKCSEKTVSRDMKDIQDRNKMKPNLPFVMEFTGDVFKKAMNHHSYLMRLARAKEASTADKIQAEFAAWKVIKELVERLQSLGYLPSRPHEIVGDIFHHLDDGGEQTLSEINKMVIELEAVAQEGGAGNAELIAEINALKQRLTKAEIEVDVTKLSEKQKEANQKKEDENVQQS